MAGKNNATATPRNSTSEGTPAQEFLNNNFPPELLEERVGGMHLVQKILRMTPEDQVKFLDKVDQV